VTTERTPTQARGPMEQWAIDRGVSVPMQGRVMFDAVGLDELMSYAREQDAIRAEVLNVLYMATGFVRAVLATRHEDHTAHPMYQALVAVTEKAGGVKLGEAPHA